MIKKKPRWLALFFAVDPPSSVFYYCQEFGGFGMGKETFKKHSSKTTQKGESGKLPI